MVDPVEIPEHESSEPASGDARTDAETKRNVAERAASKTGEERVAVKDQVRDRLLGDSFKAYKARVSETAKGLGMSDAEVEDLGVAFDELGKAMSDAMDANDGSYTKALEKIQSDGWKPTDKAHQDAMKKFLEKNTGALYDQLGKVDGGIGKTFVENMNDSGLQMMDDAPTAAKGQEVVEKVEKAVKDADEAHTDARKAFEKAQVDKEGKEAARGEKTGKSLTFDKWMKALGLLMLLGEIGYGIWALMEYCNDHSGCMEVTNDGKNPETSVKVFCKDSVTFEPQQCMCAKTSPIPTSIDTTLCGSKSDVTMIPEIDNPNCKNSGTLEVPYKYYTYRVMGPLDGIIDLGDRIIDAAAGGAGTFFKVLMKFIKGLALVLVILGLLYILFLGVRAGINHSKKKSIK